MKFELKSRRFAGLAYVHGPLDTVRAAGALSGSEVPEAAHSERFLMHHLQPFNYLLVYSCT